MLGQAGVGVALARELMRRGEAVVLVSDGSRRSVYDTLAPCVRRESGKRTAQWKQETRRYGRR
jgi:NAD(P)-dependent dehydrogenase (short-subunit alcohol dehydrogenase family)